MKRLTVDDIMRMHPCYTYPRERVEKLWAGRESLSASEILDLPIPAADRLWVFLQSGVLPDRVLLLFAAACAERRIEAMRRRGEKIDPRSAAVPGALRDYAIDAIVAARNAAAYDDAAAATDAARTAAYAARAAVAANDPDAAAYAYAALRRAGADAAAAADADAAADLGYDAYCSAYYAVTNAYRETQIADLRRLIAEEVQP